MKVSKNNRKIGDLAILMVIIYSALVICVSIIFYLCWRPFFQVDEMEGHCTVSSTGCQWLPFLWYSPCGMTIISWDFRHRPSTGNLKKGWRDPFLRSDSMSQCEGGMKKITWPWHGLADKLGLMVCHYAATLSKMVAVCYSKSKQKRLWWATGLGGSPSLTNPLTG